MKKVIAVALPKGGVGKTTTAVNLSASLAIAEKKTLLIDFDTSGACSVYLGLNPANVKADIFEVFSYSKSITQAIHHTEIENLDFIPSVLSQNNNEERIARLTANPYLFKHLLEQHVIEGYDYVIIDCPPYLKGLTTIAMIASNSIIIPVRAGQFSICALKTMLNYLLYIRRMNCKLDIEGILLTMYESKTTAWIKTVEHLNKSFSNYLFKTVIPRSVAFTESEFFGKPAILVKAKSAGANAYITLANEIIEKNCVLVY